MAPRIFPMPSAARPASAKSLVARRPARAPSQSRCSKPRKLSSGAAAITSSKPSNAPLSRPDDPRRYICSSGIRGGWSCRKVPSKVSSTSRSEAPKAIAEFRRCSLSCACSTTLWDYPFTTAPASCQRYAARPSEKVTVNRRPRRLLSIPSNGRKT